MSKQTNQYKLGHREGRGITYHKSTGTQRFKDSTETTHRERLEEIRTHYTGKKATPLDDLESYEKGNVLGELNAALNYASKNGDIELAVEAGELYHQVGYGGRTSVKNRLEKAIENDNTHKYHGLPRPLQKRIDKLVSEESLMQGSKRKRHHERVASILGLGLAAFGALIAGQGLTGYSIAHGPVEASFAITGLGVFVLGAIIFGKSVLDE